MQDKNEEIIFEEVLESEVDDIWDIFFPYMTEKKEKEKESKSGITEKTKPRSRYMRFLTM